MCPTVTYPKNFCIGLGLFICIVNELKWCFAMKACLLEWYYHKKSETMKNKLIQNLLCNSAKIRNNQHFGEFFADLIYKSVLLITYKQFFVNSWRKKRFEKIVKFYFVLHSFKSCFK